LGPLKKQELRAAGQGRDGWGIVFLMPAGTDIFLNRTSSIPAPSPEKKNAEDPQH